MERQMYEIVIQSAANGKVVARETLKAYRKNVLAKCYGKPLKPNLYSTSLWGVVERSV